MKEVAIKVVARFRPINIREYEESKAKGWSAHELRPCVVSEDNKSVTINYGGKKPAMFTLDWFLGENTKQTQAFKVVALPTVMDCIQGINGCVFAYGQTGSGKTFSMFGPEVSIEEQENMVELLGMIPQAAMIIFEYLASDKASEVAEWSCELSVMEIYVKNTLRDLLHPRKKGDPPLRLRDGARGVVVQGLKPISVTSLTDVLKAIAIANMSRTTSATLMNATSSRSHSVFTIKLKTWLQSGTKRVSTLNFCDLAGSEKIGKTGARGQQASEGMAINMSLTCLGRVINALVTHREPPFRDSALTHVLKDSLQGNCKTTILVCVSPHKFNVNESVNSLRFAMRAKLIKNKVKANKVLSRQELQKMIRQLKTEIKMLTDKLGGKVIDTMERRTLFIQFSWKDKTVEDLPNGSHGAKVWMNHAVRNIGKTHNLKSLKINYGIKVKDKRLVISIFLYENEFWKSEKIKDARDLIYKELKGMQTGLFVDADEDSVGYVSGTEQALIDSDTQAIMMKDLKASRKRHVEDSALIRQQNEELQSLRIENDNLKFGIEQMDEVIYACDLEVENMKQKIEEQDSLILELQLQLSINLITGEDSYEETEDIDPCDNESKNFAHQSAASVVKIVRPVTTYVDSQAEMFVIDRFNHSATNNIDSPQLSLEKESSSGRSARSLGDLSKLRAEETDLSVSDTELRSRIRSRTLPDDQDERSVRVGESSKKIYWRRSSERSNRKPMLSPSVRNLLGTGSALSIDINTIASFFFNGQPEDRCVKAYSEDNISELCGLFRSMVKKIWGAANMQPVKSTTHLDKQQVRDTEEKNQLLRVSAELMEQLGAFRRQSAELREELNRAWEENKTQKLATEEMALELDKYKNLMNSMSLFDKNISKRVERLRSGLEDVQTSVFTTERVEHAPDLLQLVCAQQRQLLEFNRNSLHFNQLPCLSGDEEKKDSTEDGLLSSYENNIMEWTVEEVNNWLVNFAGGSYAVLARKLEENEVNGERLCSLTPDDLRETYKMPRDKINILLETLFQLKPSWSNDRSSYGDLDDLLAVQDSKSDSEFV